MYWSELSKSGESKSERITLYNFFESDSGYDDDLYKIDTNNLKNKWYKDSNFVTGIYASDKSDAIITFEPIPLNSIELIYKGSGENLDDLETNYHKMIKLKSGLF